MNKTFLHLLLTMCKCVGKLTPASSSEDPYSGVEVYFFSRVQGLGITPRSPKAPNSSM